MKLTAKRASRQIAEPIEQIAADLQNPRRGLRAQVWLVFTLLGFIMALTGAWLSGEVLRDSFRSYIGESLNRLSGEIADSLDQDLHARYSDLKIIATVPELVDEETPAVAVRDVLERVKSSFPMYAWIGLVNPDGEVLAGTEGLSEGRDASNRPWFREGREEVYFGDLHEPVLLKGFLPERTSGGRPARYVDISLPVEGGRVLAALIRLDWAEDVAERIVSARHDRGSVEIMIIDRNASVVIGDDSMIDLEVPETIRSRVREEGGGHALIDWEDGRFLTAFASADGFIDFPGFDWLVLVRQPEEIAFAPVSEHRFNVFGWGIALTLLFGLVGWFAANYVTRPLRDLSRGARLVEAGLQKSVPVFPDRHDEIGQLSVALHQTISQLVEKDERLLQLNVELERRVQLRTAELLTANESLEAFNSMVSHDLRGPLAGMIGYLGLLKMDLWDEIGEDGRKMLAEVIESADRMNELITDHLKLSRASIGALEKSEVDISKMSEEILSRLQAREPSRRVEWHVEPGITLYSDESLMEIAMENLLGNAWKYSSRTDQAEIEVGVIEEEGEKVVFVRDNGAGFDMSKASGLFTPFKRLHSKTAFHGTGVGLSTVRRIMERHGGRIWAEAAPDKGATFYFAIREREEGEQRRA
ncbi:MAG: HAMP domain-containing protein [Acidobacteria bacterium]|nr:HAMP domain-containing protein [Acidobacteriota bacterium]